LTLPHADVRLPLGGGRLPTAQCGIGPYRCVLGMEVEMKTKQGKLTLSRESVRILRAPRSADDNMNHTTTQTIPTHPQTVCSNPSACLMG
jgi:hypothetical protein